MLLKTNQKKNNNIEETSTEDNMKKSDFIEDNILTKETTKKILIKIIKENNIRWYNLPYNYTLVKAVIRKTMLKKNSKQWLIKFFFVNILKYFII